MPHVSMADYGVLAADWKTPAAEGELIAALKTIQAHFCT